MDASPTHSNPVNEKNTLTVQFISEFLTLIAEYYPSIIEAISSVRMALSSIQIAMGYSCEKEWKNGTETSGARKERTGKQATEEFVQTLIKISQRFYEVQQNLCVRAMNLREHLKAKLPNLDEAKIQMLDDKLTFRQPSTEILLEWDTKELTQHCYFRDMEEFRDCTTRITSYMMNLYKESMAKLLFLEERLAAMLYSLPYKHGTQANAEKSLPGPPLY
ncbi:unnamed protein product [Calicophoron daubneyi]|uniref:Uncharacterized protein n=1 Tax=Calicophoron daubneyi TaxID=300641 RepID=A0AAV2T1B0_CALDB